MTLLPARCLEGEVAHGAEEEEDECEQIDTIISMQGKSLKGWNLPPHQEKTYSGQKQPVALYPELFVLL